MQADTSATKFDFKSQLDTAVNLGILCARFEWYGPPSPDNSEAQALLGSNLFIDGQILEMMRETFQVSDRTHPNNGQLDHVNIYVFDGRDRSPKFHAHLWRPSMCHNLASIEYFKPADTNPYLPYVMDALWAQNGAAKVSTIVRRAFAKVRKSKAAELPQPLPLEAHKLFLRDTLMGLRHTDPLIHFKPSNLASQPHIHRGSLVEHLGAYDRDPTWNFTHTAIEKL